MAKFKAKVSIVRSHTKRMVTNKRLPAGRQGAFNEEVGQERTVVVALATGRAVSKLKNA